MGFSLATLQGGLWKVGIFGNFPRIPHQVRALVLTSMDVAVPFNNFHEGIHYGIVRSIKKFL